MDLKIGSPKNQTGKSARGTGGGGSDTGNFSLVASYRQALEDLAGLFARRGIKVLPYRDAELPNFLALSQNRQLDVLSGAQAFFEVKNEVAASSAPELVLIDGTKQILARLDFRAPESFFRELRMHPNERGLILEIYDRESTLIYCNSIYFQLVRGLTLEEVFTAPWFDLFERDHRITEAYVEMHRRILTGEMATGGPCNIPAHEVRELQSRLRAGKIIQPKWICPVLDRNEVVSGFVNISAIL